MSNCILIRSYDSIGSIVICFNSFSPRTIENAVDEPIDAGMTGKRLAISVGLAAREAWGATGSAAKHPSSYLVSNFVDVDASMDIHHSAKTDNKARDIVSLPIVSLHLSYIECTPSVRQLSKRSVY